MTISLYTRVLTDLLACGDLSCASKILVICGGSKDRAILLDLGFSNVVISNLDTAVGQQDVAPFAWSLQNAEELSFDANSFDFAIVHLGLHHCYSPHTALGEMLRVSRTGVVVFEPKDGWFSRLGVRLGFGQQYEDSAVYCSGCLHGGVVNSEIPNFVYRFTAHELKKTVNSFLPDGRHNFRFYWDMLIPWSRLTAMKNPIHRVLMKAVAPAVERLGRLAPFANNLAAVILKAKHPDDLHAWIRIDDDGKTCVDRDWLRDKYER